MKILNIYFKNINSLEGENRIHFDQPPIVDGGVFAITGPNGSGKSSILDVITLGLYGETFRFDRPAEHVMTKSTAESFAEVEFLLSGNTYRSSWHVKRQGGSPTGALLTAEMKLVQLNGSELLIEANAQKVREKMVELTGMDFHKFSKSMVLAQGDFSAFLNALDSERMDILEKISGVDIYDEYKKQAEEKRNQAQTIVQQLEQDLNAIPVLDEATREASEHDLADFNEQLLEFKDEQSDVQQKLEQIQTVSELENQLESLNKKQKQLDIQIDENQQSLEQINSLQGVILFEDDLAVVDSKVEDSLQSKKTLDSYRSELLILQRQLKSSNFDENSATPEKTFAQQKASIDELKLKFSELKFDLPKENALLQSLKQQLEEKQSELETTNSWLKEHEVDKSLLENFPETAKLKALKTEVLELKEKQKAYTQWSKNTSEGLKKKQESIVSLKKKNNDLKEQIDKGENTVEAMAEGHTLLDLQEMKVEQQERVDNFIELLDLAIVNAKLGKKGLFSLFVGAKTNNKEEIHLQKEADQLQMEIGREQNIVKILETTASNESLLQKMQSDRVHLVDGKPCPLCGALAHPYSKHAPTVANSKQALIDQQKKLKTLVVNAESLSKQITLVQKQAKIDGEKESKLDAICVQWKSLANRLNVVSMDLDIDNRSSIKDLLKAEKIELSNISNLLKKYTSQQDTIAQARLAIETNDTSLTRLAKETEDLEIEKNSRPKEQTTEVEQAFTRSQAEEQALTEKVLVQLNSLGEKMPGKGKDDALHQRLNIRKQEYQTMIIRQKSLAENIHKAQQQADVCSSKIDQTNQQLQVCSSQVQQEEMAGLHLSLVEKQKLIAEKEKIFSQQDVELTSLKQKLTDKIKDTGQGSLVALRASIKQVKSKPELEQKQLKLNQDVAGLQNNLEKAHAQLETELAREPVQSSKEELQVQQKAIKQKLDIAKQEVGTIQNKLSKQDELKGKHQQVKDKLDREREELDACDLDIKFITDNNGLQFRQKVQKVMADKLLSKANQVLEKLSGRYYVRKVDSEHGLALEIEDTKQHNVRRLPKTLSGGESFIVSLALALGLAEMANSGHAVDSLFLDEGFGNLDAESLYLAMTTLESLKTHGKVVGVISHVEGVRKRIKTQIEMVKKPNGFSMLKIAS